MGELKIASNNLKAENITMKEKQLKQEDANKCLKLENSEVKKTSDDLKVENRTMKKKLLKQEDMIKNHELENLEFKKTSNSLKLENRTVKEEIMKQNLEISELKEKFETNKEIIKKLREQ